MKPARVHTFEEHIDTLLCAFHEPLWGETVITNITDPARPEHTLAEDLPPSGRIIVTVFDESMVEGSRRLMAALVKGAATNTVVSGGWAGPTHFARLTSQGALEAPRPRTLTSVGEWALKSTALESPRQSQ